MIQVDLTTVSLVIGILATLLAGALWVMSLISRVSIRATNIERDIKTLDERTTKVENKTDYKYQETIVTEIIVKVFNSKEVRDTLKNQIKEVILHVDKNFTAERAGVFNLLLEELKEIKNKIDEK